MSSLAAQFDPWAFEADPVTPPSASKVGNQYLNLINAYAAGAPTGFGAEAAWKPAYQSLDQAGVERSLLGGPAGTVETPYQATAGRGQWYNPATGEISAHKPKGAAKNGYVKATEPTTVNRTASSQVGASKGWLNLFSQDVAPALAAATSAGRAADVADVANLGPGAAAAVRAINPGQSALIDQLGSTAAEQLAAGTQVLPSDARRISQGVRSDWAGRGLGDSAPAQLDEALQYYGQGQNLLAQREGAAAQAANEGQLITGPALGLASGAGGAAGSLALLGQGAGAAGGAGPTIIPGAQSYDTFNTAYNANAAGKIATGNNQAAVLGGALSY